MANIPLTNGESYFIGKIDTDAVVTRGSDHAHSALLLRNGLELVGNRNKNGIRVENSGSIAQAWFSRDTSNNGWSPNATTYATKFSGGDPLLILQTTQSAYNEAPRLSTNLPDDLNNLKAGNLGLICTTHGSAAGLTTGIGFHPGKTFVNDNIGAVIVGRRVDSDTGINYRTDLIFGTNPQDGSSTPALLERVRITWDGSFQVKNYNGTNGNYLWINNDGNGRMGVSAGALDVHVDGDSMHLLRFQENDAASNPNGGVRIIGAADLIYDNPNTIAGGTEVIFDSGNKRVGIAGSTRKIKYDIGNMPNNIRDNFDKLRPVEFKFKSNHRKSLGFIAEEIAEVDPRFATWGADRMYDENGEVITIPDPDNPKACISKLASDQQVPISIDTRAIVAAAVAKIQELEARIKELESK